MSVPVVLSFDEVNTIIAGLLELPAKVSLPLIGKLNGVAQAAAAAAAAPPAPAGEAGDLARAGVEGAASVAPPEVPGA